MLTVVLVVSAAALLSTCRSSVDPVEELPRGVTVSIAMKDGTVVEGELVAVAPERVLVNTTTEGSTSVERTQIAAVEHRHGPAAPIGSFSDGPEHLEIGVPAGTILTVELETPLASNTSRVEDRVWGRTREAVMVGGRGVIPAGSLLVGTVTAARPSGEVEGCAYLAFRFSRIEVNGITYDITTTLLSDEAEGTRKADATEIGIGAAAGAIIGGITGGRKGAAVGSAVGGGAGTAGVLMTPDRDVSLPSGTPVSVLVLEGFTVQVQREVSWRDGPSFLIRPTRSVLLLSWWE